MIGRLRGSLLELDDAVAVIDVGGVGYEVEVTSGAAAKLTASPGNVEVCTHFVAREDAQVLYGFADAAERDLFRSLIKVSGVGPKLALNLLSTVSPDEFAAAIAGGNVAAITRVPGIGRKTASRLVVDLRDKVAASAFAVATPNGASEAVREAALALVALGYREQTAARMAGGAAEELGGDAAVEELIRIALKRAAE